MENPSNLKNFPIAPTDEKKKHNQTIQLRSRSKSNFPIILDELIKNNIIPEEEYILLLDPSELNDIQKKKRENKETEYYKKTIITSSTNITVTKPEEMNTFAENMLENPAEIPSIFKPTIMNFPVKTLKKSKISDKTSKTTLFEKYVAPKSYRMKKPGLNTLVVEENKQDEEKSDEWKAQENHSYLFKNNEQKPNLMRLISTNKEINEEKIEKSGFNMLEIEKNIMK